MQKTILALALSLYATPQPAEALDAYDFSNSASIEIESSERNLQEGAEIEYYDYNKGRYKTAEITEVDDSGYQTEIKLEDTTTGQTRTLELDDY